jgi:hypothetical protein
MKKNRHWNKTIFLVAVTILVMGGFILQGTGGIAQADQKKLNHEQAYRLYTKNCLDCHDSVADPEKQGKTRDEWHIVVNVMHQYGLGLTQEESEQIVDLLYDLRKGMEKEAG